MDTRGACKAKCAPFYPRHAPLRWLQCRESVLKLQDAYDGLEKQLQGAKSQAQANLTLKKEVQNLRFRLIMAGTDSSGVDADVKKQWEGLKESLVAQLRDAELRAEKLQQRIDATGTSGLANAGAGRDQALAQAAPGTSELALCRAEAALAKSRARSMELEGERDQIRLQVQELRMQGGAMVAGTLPLLSKTVSSMQ